MKFSLETGNKYFQFLMVILEISDKCGSFMRGGALEYDYDPNPVDQPSWDFLSSCFYRFGELCMVTKSVIPGFSLKLSHFGMSGHSQFLFKKFALSRVSPDSIEYIPVARLTNNLKELTFEHLDRDIFDLA